MSAWLDHVREWVGGHFTRHDDAYLAETLARAVEDCISGSVEGRGSFDDARRYYRSQTATLHDALRAYRAQHPRHP